MSGNVHHLSCRTAGCSELKLTSRSNIDPWDAFSDASPGGDTGGTGDGPEADCFGSNPGNFRFCYSHNLASRGAARNGGACRGGCAPATTDESGHSTDGSDAASNQTRYRPEDWVALTRQD